MDPKRSHAPLWIPLAGGVALMITAGAGLNLANSVRDAANGDACKCPSDPVKAKQMIARNRIISIIGMLVAVGVTLYGLSPLLRRGAEAGRGVYSDYQRGRAREITPPEE